MNWKKFREECYIESSVKKRIITELLEWAEDYKLKISRTEPPDFISKGEFIILDALIEKLNEI
mgnify:CR=1 FL=1